MGKTTITWTDYSWNPLRGTKGKWHCSKVSPGCSRCFAERINVRFGGPEYKRNADTFRLDQNALGTPLHWRKPRRVFVCSMSDLFHEDVPDDFLDRVFAVMALAPQHTFQVLTKRAERMAEYLDGLGRDFPRLEGAARSLGWTLKWSEIPLVGWPLPNVWLGVSVEDRARKGRIDVLRQIPAAVRFLSLEPLLEDLGALDLGGIHWTIIGGESGAGARPCDLAWVRSLVRQCRAAGTKCFVKQLGAAPVQEVVNGCHGGRKVERLLTVRGPKGGNPGEWPADLRVREFPGEAAP